MGPDPDPLLVSDTFQFKAPVGLLSSSQSNRVGEMVEGIQKKSSKAWKSGVVVEFW